MTLEEAIKQGQENGMEVLLVNIDKENNKGICKLIERGKFDYQEKKKEKKSKKKQKFFETRRITIRNLSIDINDIQRKINKARELLEKGCKLKVTLRLKWNEKNDPLDRKKAIEKLNAFYEKNSDIALLEKGPLINGAFCAIDLRSK